MESMIHMHGDSSGATGSCTAAELRSVFLVTDDKPGGKKKIERKENKSLVRGDPYIFFCNIICQAVTVICYAQFFCCGNASQTDVI